MRETEEMVSAKEAYLSIIQLIIHAETIGWNRFYNFLVVNSILFFAWAAIYGSKLESCKTAVILTAISLLGGISEVCWIGLVVRSKAILDTYIELGVKMEDVTKFWTLELSDFRPLSRTKEFDINPSYNWSNSSLLFMFIPSGLFLPQIKKDFSFPGPRRVMRRQRVSNIIQTGVNLKKQPPHSSW